MRISVTELDAYLQYIDDAPWMSFEELVERLRGGTFEPTLKMEAGTAFHAFLETATGCVERVESMGFVFNLDLEEAIVLPRIQEAKTERTFDIGGPVTLVGKADCVGGRKIDDHKLSEQFDAEKYADSYQWRSYLLLFDADQFTYNVFVGRESKKTGEWTVSELNKLDFYRYPDLERDVMSVLRDLVAFIRKYVPERETLGDEKLLPF